MKFRFELIVGFLVRNTTRTELNNSKLKLEYAYPGCSVTILEEKGIFESTFKIQGVNLPDEAEPVLKKWFKKIEENVN